MRERQETKRTPWLQARVADGMVGPVLRRGGQLWVGKGTEVTVSAEMRFSPDPQQV